MDQRFIFMQQQFDRQTTVELLNTFHVNGAINHMEIFNWGSIVQIMDYDQQRACPSYGSTGQLRLVRYEVSPNTGSDRAQNTANILGDFLFFSFFFVLYNCRFWGS